MTWNDRRASRWLVPLAAWAAFGLAPTVARAQFGGFGGMGWGIGFNYVPSPTNLINEAAMSRAGRAVAPESRSVYANSPNSYINSIRDNGFVPSYNAARRRPATERAPSRSSPGDQALAAGSPAPVPAPAIPARPQIPLASFFDAMRKLAWPAESPVDGEFKEKREVSDQATLQVYLQSAAHGAATLSSVADARQKLLDYGRPALHEVRAKFTPRVADTFHMFMLSLYDSLAQVATVAAPSADQPPAIP